MAKNKQIKAIAPSWDEWLSGTELTADRIVEEAKKALAFLPADAPVQQIEERLQQFIAQVLSRLPEMRAALMVALPKLAMSGKGPVEKSPTDGVV